MLLQRYKSRICRKRNKSAQKAGMSYVYDDSEGMGGTLIADNLVGGATTTWGQSARYIYLPTASGPMPVAAIYGTKHYAIQSDHLNTPRRLIQSDGQVAWQWAYSAFGEEKPTIAKNRFANTDLNQSFGSTTVPAVTFNLRYPGQYFDQESNLHYNYHRSYSATTGRYTQADPIGLDGGWNRFGYVGQNPLGFTDPLGLAKWTVIDNFQAGMVGGIGGQYAIYKLQSGCNSSGVRYTITVHAAGVSAGVGLSCKKCFAAPFKIPLGGTFEDHSSEPSPNAFNGAYYSGSAGLMILGFGGEYGDTVLGRATSLRDFTPNMSFGNISAELSGTIGTSTVLEVKTEKCDCNAK